DQTAARLEEEACVRIAASVEREHTGQVKRSAAIGAGELRRASETGDVVDAWLARCGVVRRGQRDLVGDRLCVIEVRDARDDARSADGVSRADAHVGVDRRRRTRAGNRGGTGGEETGAD